MTKEQIKNKIRELNKRISVIQDEKKELQRELDYMNMSNFERWQVDDDVYMSHNGDWDDAVEVRRRF